MERTRNKGLELGYLLTVMATLLAVTVFPSPLKPGSKFNPMYPSTAQRGGEKEGPVLLSRPLSLQRQAAIKSTHYKRAARAPKPTT
ncbi:MAG: hypothetical protein AB7F66_01245 [Bacteriovoracia bacterium]